MFISCKTKGSDSWVHKKGLIPMKINIEFEVFLDTFISVRYKYFIQKNTIIFMLVNSVVKVLLFHEKNC